MSLLAILCLVALLLMAGPMVAPLAQRRWAGAALYGGCGAVCTILLVVAGGALRAAGIGLDPQEMALPLGVPGIGANFRLDALAAFFLIVVNLGGATASLFALGYGRGERAPNRVLPFFPVFLAALNLVVIANDAFVFLFAWELMSVASWFLVIAHHHKAENRRAGTVYLIMAVLSFQMLLMAFSLLSGFGSHLDFDTMRTLPPDGWTARVVVLAVVIGAGGKAGLVPLHVWLPLAHPAAPSHVSALMSGVMTKVALYGLIRIVFDLLGPPEWGWGVALLVLGSVSAVLGVLYALMEHDLKRLLAYSTVENIGIIAIGLGLALAFRANGLPLGAALALTAALFHILNHSLFKSLLFFGAGSVAGATGARALDHLGGLIHGMPWTAACFLVGALAISGLPPLNGFVSEWLVLQAILISPDLPQWVLKILVPTVGAGLALAAALTAACYVKAFGIAFLGRSRSAEAAHARETDRVSLAAMLVLAVACGLAGVLPGLVVDALAPVVGDLVNAHLPVQASDPWLTLVATTPERSSYNALILMVFIVGSASTAFLAIRWLAARGTRHAIAWGCGYPESSPRAQYSAGSLVQPIRRVFASVVFWAEERVEMPAPGVREAARLHLGIVDPVWEGFYRPVILRVLRISEWVTRIRGLSVRQNLRLVFAVLIVLLVVVVLWR